MNNVQVSIIIVNYNTCAMTQECINSVLEKTKDISFEIILIDNASKDGSKEHFQKQEKEGKIRYVYSFENMGFGRANNVGMMLAKGEYFFLLNSDTLLVNNAVKEFYDYAKYKDVEGKYNFYGSWLLDKEGETTVSYGHKKTLGSLLKMVVMWYIFHFFRKNNLESNCGGTLEVGSVSGADMFFNRIIVDKYGGFDHAFFMYGEENEWQNRMPHYGIKSYIIEQPKIIHLEGRSSGSFGYSKTKEFSWGEIMNQKSNILYVKKNYNLISYVVFRFLFLILKFK